MLLRVTAVAVAVAVAWVGCLIVGLLRSCDAHCFLVVGEDHHVRGGI